MKNLKSYFRSLMFGAYLCLMFVVNSFVGWLSPYGHDNNPVTYAKPVNHVVPTTDTYTDKKVDDLSNYRQSAASGRCINIKATV